MDNVVKDALDHVRADAQDLHKKISDARAKRGAPIKADLESLSQKAKAVTASVKGSMGAQNEVAKKHLKEAIGHLEAMQRHAADTLKNSGQAFQTSVGKVLTEARASVQKLSEAVAAKRAAAFAKTHK